VGDDAQERDELMPKEWPRYKGYVISRGSYVDSCDDCIDGWYIHHPDSDTWDRRGPGHPTLRAAKAAITNWIQDGEWYTKTA